MKIAKKPIVLCTTKHDQATPETLKGFDKFLSRKEVRALNIHHVETSSHNCVNVDVVFAQMAHLIDKRKSKQMRNIEYRDAYKDRIKAIDKCRRAYISRVQMLMKGGQMTFGQLIEHLGSDNDYFNVVHYCGLVDARNIYSQCARQLRFVCLFMYVFMYVQGCLRP
jgi:hypothetical protein